MIDFHCHLDLYPDALKLLSKVDRMSEFTFAVTTSPRAYLATSRVFRGYQNIHVGLGLHPEVAVQKSSEKSLLFELIKGAPLVGEIGLDGSPRFKDSLSLQADIFTGAVAECSRVGGRLMSIHSRGAENRVLDILESHPQAGTPVLHWFTGTFKQAARAVEIGCWFSVGPAMLNSEKGRQLTSTIPLERVLPESDGPLAQWRGKALMPWDAAKVAELLAPTAGYSAQDLSERFSLNLANLLRLSKSKK